MSPMNVQCSSSRGILPLWVFVAALLLHEGSDAWVLMPLSRRNAIPSLGRTAVTNQRQLEQNTIIDKSDDAFVRQSFESQDLDKNNTLFHPIGKGIEDQAAPSRQNDAATTFMTAATDDDVVLPTPAFPMSSIVNQDTIKRALSLAAANPRLGASGVLLQGGRGTCKSVLARSVQSWLRNHDNADNTDTNRTAAVRVIHIPLQVLEDALLGSVDLEQSLATGKACFAPGILAKAHQQVMVVDDIHLMDESVAALLLQALADGQVQVEREGLSVTYPCRPRLVVATANPTEVELRESWMDRFAITLYTDANPLTVQQRVQVAQNVEQYYDHPSQYQSKSSSSSSLLSSREESKMRDSIEQARTLLPDVAISSEQILYLCQEASRAQCQGQRAELFATEIAKTCAAMDGRLRVTADDLQEACFLAIATRAQVPFMNYDDDEEEGIPQQPQSQLQPLEPEPDIMPPPSQQEQDNQEDQSGQEDDTIMEDTSQTEDDQEEEEQVLEIPLEFMFDIDMTTSVNPKLLQFRKKLTRKGKGGKRTKIFSTHRGRFVKAIYPKAGQRSGRLALGATLRAAAPYQRIRRQFQTALAADHSVVAVTQNQTDVSNSHVEAIRRRRQRQTKTPLVYITKEDFRIQRMSRKAGTLVVFVVDASGSMALNRMGAAKGAAMTLLKEAYKSRDKIALVAFHGPQAQVVVPPTKSMSMTRQRLESLPCGGGSPLAHALEVAMRTGLNEVKVKKDVGRVILVLLSDGRANIPLDVSHGDVIAQQGGISSDRKLLREEVLGVAKQLALLENFDLLCIDTEDHFVGTGIAREVTRVALGNYHHLSGTADCRTVTHLVQEGIQNGKI